MKKKERVMESTEGQLMRITQQRNKESNITTTVSESSKAKGNRKILMENTNGKREEVTRSKSEKGGAR